MLCQDTIINNKLDISICLDTGASASCIREEVYRKLKIGKPLTHAKIKVTGIGESSIQNRPISLGKVKLKLQFKGKKGILEHEFIVLRNLIPPILIGNDFLRKFKATIDCGSNKLTYQLLNSKEVLETNLRTVRNYAKEEGEVIYLTDHTAFLVDMEEDNSHKARKSSKSKRIEEDNSHKTRKSSKSKRMEEDNSPKARESSKPKRMEEDNSHRARESSTTKRKEEDNSHKVRKSSKIENREEDNLHKTKDSSKAEKMEEDKLHKANGSSKKENMEEDNYRKTEGSSEIENTEEDYSKKKMRSSRKDNKVKRNLQKGKGFSKKHMEENPEEEESCREENEMEDTCREEAVSEDGSSQGGSSEEEFIQEMEDSKSVTEDTENRSSDTEMESSDAESGSSDTETYTGRYECNECQEVPIKRDRFHCDVCNDYDLCHKCHTEGIHSQHTKTRVPMTVKEYAVVLTENLEIPGRVEYHITCNSEDTWDFKIAKLKIFGFKPEQIQMKAIIEDENKPGDVIISIKNNAKQTAIIPVGAKLGTTYGIDNLKVEEDCKNCVELIELTEVSIMEIEENQSEVYPDYSCNAKSVSWYYSD